MPRSAISPTGAVVEVDADVKVATDAEVQPVPADPQKGQ
jgi:hypothetical protein